MIGLAAAMSAWLQVSLVGRVCRRNTALKPHQPLLITIAAMWCLVLVLRATYLDAVMPPADEIGHDWTARQIAQHLVHGEFALATDYFGVGNHGYQFVLGVFYALTHAPMVITRAINGSLGFWAMLTMLETLCRSTGCARVPTWTIAMTAGLPSAAFWTTANLKEGPILWGISMMLSLVTHYDRPLRSRDTLLLPLAGLLTVGLFRPHIAAAWLTGIASAVLICRRRIVTAAVCGVCIIAAFVLLQAAAPKRMDTARDAGFVVMLEESYETRDHIGGSAIQQNQTPIPIASGLLLIFLRPLPYECNDLASVLAGSEVWVISLIVLFGWLRLRGRIRLCEIPLIVASLIALLLLSFFFSYTYNMGLMVRQRLQAFPALIALAAVPYLVSSRQGICGRNPIRPILGKSFALSCGKR